MERKPWEDMDGGPCPRCGAMMGTRWREESGQTYYIRPGENMGNKSYDLDECIRGVCPECGYTTPEGRGWLPGGRWETCVACGRGKRVGHPCPRCGKRNRVA